MTSQRTEDGKPDQNKGSMKANSGKGKTVKMRKLRTIFDYDERYGLVDYRRCQGWIHGTAATKEEIRHRSDVTDRLSFTENHRNRHRYRESRFYTTSGSLRFKHQRTREENGNHR